MHSFTAPSGAAVVINAAAWKDAKILKRAIEREVASFGNFDLRTFLMVDASEAVDAALGPCLIRCTYNNEKITDSIFDKVENRQDYYDIAQACIKENLLPLVESLRSKLIEAGLLKTQAPVDQKSS